MHTATLPPVAAAPAVARLPRAATVAVGLFAGLFAGAALGVVARGWMRLVTDDPEFTWSGTIFIVMAFTLTGLGHGVAWAARRSSRRRWSTSGRVAGAVLSLSIFGGAGAVMLPTVLFGALARWRADWRPATRCVLAVPALAAPAFVTIDVVRAEVSAGRLCGLALFGVTYWLVIHSAGAIVAPLDDGWRMRRGVRVALVTGIALAVTFVAVGVTGLQG